MVELSNCDGVMMFANVILCDGSGVLNSWFRRCAASLLVVWHGLYPRHPTTIFPSYQHPTSYSYPLTGAHFAQLLGHGSPRRSLHVLYEKLPYDIAERHVLLMDPILASGNTCAAAIEVPGGCSCWCGCCQDPRRSKPTGQRRSGSLVVLVLRPTSTYINLPNLHQPIWTDINLPTS